MKFLVATDGPAPALRAVRYAAKLIAPMNSPEHKVTLVSVLDTAGVWHDIGDPHRQRCRGDRRATAKRPVILVK